MNKKTTNLFLLALISLTLYLPFLQTYGWKIINKPAIDFPSFYVGPKLVYELDLTPYNQENWAVAETLHDDTLYAFLYLPPAVPLLRVLNVFDYKIAKQAMLAVNHIFVLLVSWLILSRILKWKLTEPLFLVGVVYILSYFPMAETLRLGQINLIILSLLLLMWLGIREQWHPAIPGASLALATILKFNPAIFFVYLILKREFKVFFWGLGIFLGITFGTLFILPAGMWQDWAANVLSPGVGETIRGLFPSGLSNQGINGFTARTFLGHKDTIAPFINIPTLVKPIAYSLILIVTLPSLFLVYWKSVAENRSEKNFDLEISLILIVMYLVTPLSWNHHLVFVLPAIFIAMQTWLAEEQKNWVWGSILIGIFVLLNYDFPFSLEIFQKSPWSLLISSKFYGVVILWVYLLLQVWKSKTSSTKRLVDSKERNK